MTHVSASGAVLARDVLLRVTDEADRYALHAALDERFGRRGDSGFLWSVGRVADGPAVRVRLSPDHPGAKSGIAITAPHAGTERPFRLRANVTRKIGAAGKRASWPRSEIEPRLCWLERRGTEHGFAVEHVEAVVGRVFIRKGRGFWLDETCFAGRLRVTEELNVAAALLRGIGQTPAFGFGLLELF